MTYEQLEHAIRAACQVSGDDELFVFGSQALLAEHPEAPATLRASIEVDIQPKNRPEMVDVVDGSLGEGSMFQEAFGFYVHGVAIEAAKLPEGWESRTVTVSHPRWTRGGSGLCLESHDLAASKLAAFREKDVDFVRTLLLERMISPEILLVRVATLPVDDEARQRLSRWIELTVEGVA